MGIHRPAGGSGNLHIGADQLLREFPQVAFRFFRPGGGLLHRLAQLLEGRKLHAPGGIKRGYTPVALPEPGDQLPFAAGVGRVAQHLVGDDQVVHEGPARLVAQEVADHPGILPAGGKSLGAGARVLGVLGGQHVREVPEDHVGRAGEPGQAGHIGHAAEEGLVRPVAQGVHARLLQLADDHAPPGFLPALAKGPVQVRPLEGEHLPLAPVNFAKALAHGGVHGLPGRVVCIRQPGEQPLHTVHPGVAAHHDAVRPHAEERAALRVGQVPAAVTEAAAEVARAFHKRHVGAAAPGRPGGEWVLIGQRGLAPQEARQRGGAFRLAGPGLGHVLAHFVNEGRTGRGGHGQGRVRQGQIRQAYPHIVEGADADQLRPADVLPGNAGAVADHLQLARGVAGEENVSVQPVQVDGDGGIIAGHQAEADDHPGLGLIAPDPQFKGHGMLLHHRQGKVQVPLGRRGYLGQGNAAARSGQQQGISLHHRAGKQPRCINSQLQHKHHPF